MIRYDNRICYWTARFQIPVWAFYHFFCSNNMVPGTSIQYETASHPDILCINANNLLEQHCTVRTNPFWQYLKPRLAMLVPGPRLVGQWNSSVHPHPGSEPTQKRGQGRVRMGDGKREGGREGKGEAAEVSKGPNRNKSDSPLFFYFYFADSMKSATL